MRRLNTWGASTYDDWKTSDPRDSEEPLPALPPYDGPSHDRPPVVHHALCVCGRGACWNDVRTKEGATQR